MAAINITAVQSLSTQNSSNTTIGPNVSANFGTVTILCTQSPVTAYALGYSFVNPQPYENEAPIFILVPTGLSSIPAAGVKISSNPLYTTSVLLSALVDEGALGVFRGNLFITLSSSCLSSSTGINGAGTAVPVDITTQIVSLSTMTITAINLPYHNQVCADRFRRARLLGLC